MKTAFLEAGFRPMSLAAGAWSALAVAIWLAFFPPAGYARRFSSPAQGT